MSESENDKPLETLQSAIKEMVDQQRKTNERLDSVATEVRSGLRVLADKQEMTNERLDSVSTELRSGLQVLADKQDKTNERLDATNERLDKTNERLDATNERLDKTNERLDKTNERLDSACLEFRAGFNYLAKEQIKTNEKLDVTNSKLDSTITSLYDFRMHVSKKLDGVGTYLMSIDDQLHDHEKWLRRLDERFKPGHSA
jgi:chromosome segregation ATPase